VLGRILLATLLLVAPVADATASVEIRATCVAELARDPAHLRTLRRELARALGGTRVPARYTLDVSLVRLTAAVAGNQVEVRAEVRALLSDAQGRARYQTTSRVTVRGPSRERISIQRDAVTAVAHELAGSVHAAAR
jgi:hypothetical protein